MNGIGSLIAVAAAMAVVTLAASGARADSFDDACAELDRTRQTSCSVERPRGKEWVLNTGFEVGAGRKASVEIVEARFCQAARRAGVAGRVLRRNALPGVLGNGAIMEWQCGPAAVSAAPRR